jgi:hypothetical protein
MAAPLGSREQVDPGTQDYVQSWKKFLVITVTQSSRELRGLEQVFRTKEVGTLLFTYVKTVTRTVLSQLDISLLPNAQAVCKTLEISKHLV